jgi:hypothetical protein
LLLIAKDKKKHIKAELIQQLQMVQKLQQLNQILIEGQEK